MRNKLLNNDDRSKNRQNDEIRLIADANKIIEESHGSISFVESRRDKLAAK